MSGWIKLEKSLEADPRVLRMAREFSETYSLAINRAGVDLCNDPVTLKLPAVTLVCGALSRMWSYADTHMQSDDTLAIGPLELNELVGLPGFAQSCPQDWLIIIDEHTLKLPNYQQHNGIQAKRKAMTQKRVERYRGKNKKSNARVTVKALPDQDQDQDQDHIHRGVDFDTFFEQWWSKFPPHRKGSKGPAKKKMQSLINRRKVTAEQLMSGLDRYLEAGYGDSTFACGAERWMNDERWTIERFPVPGDIKTASDDKPETVFEKAVRVAKANGMQGFRGAAGDPPETELEFIARVLK